MYVYPVGFGWKIYYNHTHYGTFSSKEGAEMYRDVLIENGVIHPYKENPQRYIHKTRNNTWIIQKDNQTYGTYKNLNDAMDERDWLERNNWNYDELEADGNE